ncbi:metal-dependent hydrolase [Corynebacterium capitovis DSM 44611]|uniref:MBL fold metallo-hydrolase n=1 Tax=Corynebacterium capitovis TaxID=131081 RepID=UPI00037E2A64|nr:MBL fold metallo-hydrolase [Corynebacterium capitovis]WKD58064.1 metal-dependent hydrolase [Corynebacterium capitovis DSM 44611]
MNLGIQCTFYGTSSVHLFDGRTSIFIDAFLTRPSAGSLIFRRISPNEDKIGRALRRGGVDKLDALFVAHSHFDHVLDSAAVLKRFSGTFYGSASSLNVGRGEGLEEARLGLIKDGDTLNLGEFTVSVIDGLHSPGNLFPGRIGHRLASPARAWDYRCEGSFSFHLAHPLGNILIVPSANFVPGFLDGFEADIVYLGIGTLGRQSPEFKKSYWAHTVEAVNPQLVVPIHWDNFTRSLDKPLKDVPFPADNVRSARRFLRNTGVPVHFPEAFDTVTLGPHGISYAS